MNASRTQNVSARTDLSELPATLRSLGYQVAAKSVLAGGTTVITLRHAESLGVTLTVLRDECYLLCAVRLGRHDPELANRLNGACRLASCHVDPAAKPAVTATAYHPHPFRRNAFRRFLQAWMRDAREIAGLTAGVAR